MRTAIRENENGTFDVWDVNANKICYGRSGYATRELAEQAEKFAHATDSVAIEMERQKQERQHPSINFRQDPS